MYAADLGPSPPSVLNKMKDSGQIDLKISLELSLDLPIIFFILFVNIWIQIFSI